MEHCIKQNNAIDIYEEYFGEIEDEEFDQVCFHWIVSPPDVGTHRRVSFSMDISLLLHYMFISKLAQSYEYIAF